MPAILRRALGHDDEVPDARTNVLVAARADVELAGLIGLHALHVDRPVEMQVGHPKRAHIKRSTQAITAAPTMM